MSVVVSADRPLGQEDVATLAQLACLLEASAPKPGNVSPGRGFQDMRYEDFLVSALAIGPAMAAAGRVGLGATVAAARQATRRWTKVNTNLGIVLLLAPLARAALVPGGGTLRDRLHEVLAATTVEDAEAVYTAIAEAVPGGMGTVEHQDLSSRPTVTLREAMALARERDAVAREYVTDFAITFGHGVPALREARMAGLGWLEGAVEVYLSLLAEWPDTLIARKWGPAEAERVTVEARAVRAAGGTGTPEGRRRLAAFDEALRDAQNSRNPGTTADLTAASLFVVLLECRRI